jgi:hypothetical protein
LARDSIEEDLPPRTTAAAIAGVLRGALIGLEPVLLLGHWPTAETRQATVYALIGSKRPRWRVVLSVRDGWPVRVWEASAPDGANWSFGCERDDWSLGPESRLVDPFDFLGPSEVDELREVLLAARNLTYQRI